MMSEAAGMGLEHSRRFHHKIGTSVLVISWGLSSHTHGLFLKWCLIFQGFYLQKDNHELYYRVSKTEVQVLLKPGHSSPRMPFLLHFIGETEHKTSPDTKNEKIYSTSLWEEWQAHMGMETLLAAISIENLSYWGIACPLVSLSSLSIGLILLSSFSVCLYVGMKRYLKTALLPPCSQHPF